MKNRNSVLKVLGFLILIFVVSCEKEAYISIDAVPCDTQMEDILDGDKYQDILDQFTTKGVVGVTAIIAKPGQNTWIGSSGFSSVEENKAMNNCNLHHTASLAKSFVAIITLQLIEEGKLDFDTKIEDLLTDEIRSIIPEIGQLTVKHLLQQTSGLPDIFELNFISDFMNDPEEVYTRVELLEYVAKKELLSEPGTEHHYSDTNFILLSFIIDQLEGDHIEAIQKRIVQTLNLQNVYYHNGSYPNINGLAASYWDQYNDGKIENITSLQKRVTSYIKGSDGIISNPMDMFAFYENVFQGDLISDPMLELIKSEVVREEEEQKMNTGYSHGFMLIEEGDQKWIGHAGSQLGASCFVFHNLNSGVSIGVFTNTGTFMFQEKQSLIFFRALGCYKSLCQLDGLIFDC